MTASSIDQLAELQERQASPEATPGRASEDIFRELADMGDDLDLARVESLTAELVSGLREAKKLHIAMVREEFVTHLNGKLKSPARVFDNAMADCGAIAKKDGDSGQGRGLAFGDPLPWPDSVDGVEVLDDIKAVFRRFVIMEEAAYTVLALWVLHTYVYDVAWITPRLAITSPEKRCGKTLLLTILERLVAKPLMSANASPAAIFRCVEQDQPTLLIDEGDTFLHGKDELRGILNSGHQKNGHVLRTVGEDHEPRLFLTFAPCAIAMIGKLPDTLEDRSVAVRMARKRSGDVVERLRMDQLGELEDLRRRAFCWVNAVREYLPSSDPEVPEELHDRAADNWRILLTLADVAGGEWPALARQAAIETSTQGQDSPGARVCLLQDLQALFQLRGDRVSSQEIVDQLIEMEERPWPEWKHGKPLTVRQLAKLLEPFGIKPRQIRFGKVTLKGYLLEDCEDAFERYLSDPIRNNRNEPMESVTYDHPPSETGGVSVSDPKRAQTPGSMGVVSDVSDPEREAVAL